MNNDQSGQDSLGRLSLSREHVALSSEGAASDLLDLQLTERRWVIAPRSDAGLGYLKCPRSSYLAAKIGKNFLGKHAANIDAPISVVNRHVDIVFRHASRMEITKTLGERVRARRKELKMTQVALANLVGIKQPSLSDIENGETTEMKGSTLLQLAAALRMNPEFLRTGRGSMILPIDPNVEESEALGIFRALLNKSLRAAWLETGHSLVRSPANVGEPKAKRTKPTARRES